ncbi:hypothetical protein H7H48_05755 [Nitratireductor sp. B36]|uniref:hypothetical protein n=1 Tax=Nitratireductor sp. B36 TaxID=2762059 RepID=UPI001E3C5B77|nr:hypothetical protein [Nitratireductor sp. B36]MCC5778548.1 hypothetical protein [Nitratireductor sp. B36]
MDEKTIDAGELDGVISGLLELELIADYGFYNQLRRNNWRKLEAEFWLFKDRQFHMIANFPGDGRAETKDVCVVVARVINHHADPDPVSALLNIARDRMRIGRPERWNHEL